MNDNGPRRQRQPRVRKVNLNNYTNGTIWGPRDTPRNRELAISCVASKVAPILFTPYDKEIDSKCAHDRNVSVNEKANPIIPSETLRSDCSKKRLSDKLPPGSDSIQKSRP